MQLPNRANKSIDDSSIVKRVRRVSHTPVTLSSLNEKMMCKNLLNI